MSKLSETIGRLVDRASSPGKAIALAVEESGREPVGCFPIYTPEEIVYAGGFLPVGMWGGKTGISAADRYVQGFCCSIMRANLELGARGVYDGLKAILIPGLCDTLKCVIENWKVLCPQVPMIAMIHPQARWAGCSEDYLIAEYRRVRSELEKATRTLISDRRIEQAFAVYEHYRQTMREFVALAADYPRTIDAKTRHLILKAGYFMDKKLYTEDIRAIIDGLKKLAPEPFGGIRVVATGLLGEPGEILDIFSESGLAVVADDLAQESRQFRTPAREGGTVWQRMAWRILDQRGCTFLCEEKKTRGHMLIEMVKQSEAKAVVICMMKFCDPEEFDYPIYKKELEAAGIPMLYLELDQQMDSFEQTRTRVQSFAEMME